MFQLPFSRCTYVGQFLHWFSSSACSRCGPIFNYLTAVFWHQGASVKGQMPIFVKSPIFWK